jgi:hypothetical protein
VLGAVLPGNAQVDSDLRNASSPGKFGKLQVDMATYDPVEKAFELGQFLADASLHLVDWPSVVKFDL